MQKIVILKVLSSFIWKQSFQNLNKTKKVNIFTKILKNTLSDYVPCKIVKID